MPKLVSKLFLPLEQYHFKSIFFITSKPQEMVTCKAMFCICWLSNNNEKTLKLTMQRITYLSCSKPQAS